ncbi:MAG: hypothetical protein ACKOQ4_03575 [Mycobacterium sp.]
MNHQAEISRAGISKRRVTALTFIGAVAVGGALATAGFTAGTGTANATDCGWANGGLSVSGTASADCDGIQGGGMYTTDMSPSSMGAVDGQGWIDGQGVEDHDGVQGDVCGAGAPGSVPRCS